jgi:hypothetical protein
MGDYLRELGCACVAGLVVVEAEQALAVACELLAVLRADALRARGQHGDVDRVQHRQAGGIGLASRHALPFASITSRFLR